MIPGNNVLGLAFGLIKTEEVQWLRATGRTENALGNHITQYADPVNVRGSWQPVPQSMYKKLGLSMAKKYYNFYANASILPVERNTSGDVIVRSGNRYQVDDEDDWFEQDGWRMIRCILIGPTS